MRLTVFLVLLAAYAAAGAAYPYPDRPVRLIVPYAPGGAVDMVGRLMAQDMTPRLGQQVVVDNRAGGGGVVGIELAARAAPDGYTLLVGSVGVASMPGMHSRLSFDPVKDFAVIIVSISGTYLLGVNPSIGVGSVKDLIALAKQRPRTLNFGSSGPGSTIHLAGEMLKSMAGIELVHVPYKSAGLALTDVIAGNIQLMFAPVIVMQPQAKAGKVRAIGVTSAKRSQLMPELPTIAEAGVPGFEVSGWYGLLAPAATPRERLQRLYNESKKGMEEESMKERLRAQGLEVITMSPQESAAFLRADIARWSKVIRDAGVKAE